MHSWVGLRLKRSGCFSLVPVGYEQPTLLNRKTGQKEHSSSWFVAGGAMRVVEADCPVQTVNFQKEKLKVP